MKNIALDLDLDLVTWAVAVELATSKVGVAGLEAVVNGRVQRVRHCVLILFLGGMKIA